MGELLSNGVQIYQFPSDDETVAELNTSMNVRYNALLQDRLKYSAGQG